MNSHAASAYGVVTEPGTVRIERLLPGPIERLWSYLTQSDKRGAWLASGPMELRVGGRVENVFRNSRLASHDDPPPPKYAHVADEHLSCGEVTACEPPRLLAYTWGEVSGERSEVRFELTPRADKVQMVITHRRLVSYDNMLSVAAGWHTHLDILAAKLDGREPVGFWKAHTRLEAEYQRRIASSEVASTFSNAGD